jgi:hypothetical protein
MTTHNVQYEYKYEDKTSMDECLYDEVAHYSSIIKDAKMNHCGYALNTVSVLNEHFRIYKYNEPCVFYSYRALPFTIIRHFRDQ